jgi:cAMP-dependent protein kinase regulator
VDFEVNGKIVGSAKAGETFGELDLLYDENDKISTIVANAEDTKLIRLDQKAFRGIVQSQTKQEEEEKRALLQKVPFLKDLLWHKNGIEINKDTTNRLCMFMKPQVFLKGDTIVEEGDEAAAGTLYMVHAGTIELTSLNKDKFVLGPDAYVGKKAIMGVAGKGEPTVSSIAGHRDGKVYSIDKTDVNEVLGKNYFSREASRRQDSKKLVRSISCGRNSLNPFFWRSRILVVIMFVSALFPKKIGWL